ncbi:MAG: hypothetical protein M1816_000014 [Peltula sp. TS41687]|nr:MAG: hypothetical protein M1816_000014 [Peltula sp. TS41687]
MSGTSPQWLIDLNEPPPPIKPKSSKTEPSPKLETGQDAKIQWNQRASKHSSRTPPSTEETDTLKLKKAWELALAPAKSLPMNAIMMYMSGNSLQIFSIMMVFMLFQNPIKGLLATNQAFSRFESEGTRRRLYSVKAVYVLMQLVALGLGLWKVNAMGLLPNTRSDWLAWETTREPVERAIFAF